MHEIFHELFENTGAYSLQFESKHGKLKPNYQHKENVIMNCKFCGAELGEDSLLCPACGKDNDQLCAPDGQVESVPVQIVGEQLEAVGEYIEEAAEHADIQEDTLSEDAPEEQLEEPKKAPVKWWKILLAAVCSVLLVGVLTVLVLQGMGIDLIPNNDVTYKSSYTMEDAEASALKDKVVASMNGRKLTNEELQAHFWGQVYNFVDYYGANYFDYSLPLDSQTFSAETGMTWQQYFLQITIDNWSHQTALALLAEEEGFTPDDSAILTLREDLEKAAVDYGFESADAMVRADMGEACGVDAYIAYIELIQMVNQYIDYKYTQWEPTVQDLDAYYVENEAAFLESGITKDSGLISDVRHILIMPEGEKTDGEYSKAQWDACLQEAEKILDMWKTGEATDASFAEFANTYSEDGGSNTTGGLYEGITSSSNFVENFRNWAVDASRQPGDTGIVQSNYGYHIMYYVDGEPMWMTAARSNYLMDKLNAHIVSGQERWPAEIKYKNIALTDANVVTQE